MGVAAIADSSDSLWAAITGVLSLGVDFGKLISFKLTVGVDMASTAASSLSTGSMSLAETQARCTWICIFFFCAGVTNLLFAALLRRVVFVRAMMDLASLSFGDSPLSRD